MKGADTVLAFLIEAAQRGEKTALVTLTDVEGGASRAIGAQMAVGITGRYAGSLSSGCVERAVVGEAQRIIGGGRTERVRFGTGSRYIDIRLPCGGAMDLLFTPAPPLSVLQKANRQLAARQSVSLELGLDGSIRLAAEESPTGWANNGFIIRHDPALRIVIVGHGAETTALAFQARLYGASVQVLSPDTELVAKLRSEGIAAEHLLTPSASQHMTADRHSAIVFLFHDHDWETALLAQALDQPAFFVGAMGSRATHRQRCALLADAGVSPAAIARIQGPLGIIQAARDPDTLALSALAQIVADYRNGLDTAPMDLAAHQAETA